jgi:hypothetical protein
MPILSSASLGICCAGMEKLLEAKRERHSNGQHFVQADDFDLEGLLVLSAFVSVMTAQKVSVYGGSSVQ